MLNSYRASVSAAQLAQRGFRGSLRVGIMRDSFEPCLPVIFREFHRLYPQISLIFQGYSHSKLLAAFEKGEVDAVLNYLPLPDAKQRENLVLLHRNQQCVPLYPDHPLAKRESLRMEELKDEPFVVMVRTVSIPGHDFIWKTAAEAGFAPNVVAEAGALKSCPSYRKNPPASEKDRGGFPLFGNSIPSAAQPPGLFSPPSGRGLNRPAGSAPR